MTIAAQFRRGCWFISDYHGAVPARLLLYFRFDAVSPYLPRTPGERGYCKPPLAELS